MKTIKMLIISFCLIGAAFIGMSVCTAEESVPTEGLRIVSPAQHAMLTRSETLQIESSVNAPNASYKIVIEKFDASTTVETILGQCALIQDTAVALGRIDPASYAPGFYRIKVEFDGYPGLVAEIEVFFGRGNGASYIPITQEGAFSDPTIYDVNRDGKKEVMAIKGQSLWMLKGGTITETPLGYTPLTDGVNYPVPLYGNVDGMADVDMVIPFTTTNSATDACEGYVAVYLFLTSGAFAPHESYIVLGPGEGNVIDALALADLDRDGADEIIIAKRERPDEETLLVYKFHYGFIEVASVGQLPLIKALAVHAPTQRIFIGTADSASPPEVICYAFTQEALIEEARYVIQELGDGSIESLILADMDKSSDEEPEVLAQGLSLDGTKRCLSAFTMDGAAVFTPVIIETQDGADTLRTTTFSIADMDGDGYLEIVMPINAVQGGRATSSVRVYARDGTLKFETERIGEGICTAVIGDVTDDGKADIIASNAYDGSYLMRNIYAWSGVNGSPITGYPITVPCSVRHEASASNHPVLCDINNNNVLDIFSRGLCGPIFKIQTNATLLTGTARMYLMKGLNPQNTNYCDTTIVNVAKGKTVNLVPPTVEDPTYCLAANRRYYKSNMTDGVTRFNWYAEPSAPWNGALKLSAAYPGGSWYDPVEKKMILFDYEVDLGGFYDINTVKFYWGWSGDQHVVNGVLCNYIESWKFFYYSYQGSGTGSWQAVPEASSNVRPGAALTERKVKITTNKIRIKAWGVNWSGIFELEAYGKILRDFSLPPRMLPIAGHTVNEGATLKFTISAIDPDSSTLTYFAFHLPKGSVFDEATRVFSWTPTYEQAGSYTITLMVSDGTNVDSKTAAITVNNVNRPPVMDPIEDQVLDEGGALQFVVSGKDPDNDELTYTAGNLPGGASFDSATCTLSWTPTYEQAGIYENISFTVSDGMLADSKKITVTVNDMPTPRAPTNLIVDRKNSWQINLMWQDNANDEYGYKVERSANSQANYVVIAELPVDAVTYMDTSVSHDTTYYYRVFAYGKAGNSGYSNMGYTVTTGGPKPKSK